MQRITVFFASVQNTAARPRSSPSRCWPRAARAAAGVARPGARRHRRVHRPPRPVEDVAERHRPRARRGPEHRVPQGRLGRQRRPAGDGPRGPPAARAHARGDRRHRGTAGDHRVPRRVHRDHAGATRWSARSCATSRLGRPPRHPAARGLARPGRPSRRARCCSWRWRRATSAGRTRSPSAHWIARIALSCLLAPPPGDLLAALDALLLPVLDPALSPPQPKEHHRARHRDPRRHRSSTAPAPRRSPATSASATAASSPSARSTRPRREEIDADGALVTPGLPRPAHPLRRPGHLGRRASSRRPPTASPPSCSATAASASRPCARPTTRSSST